jgi:hypothetical protein
VPKRNTGRPLCGLHNIRQRWRSTVHFLSEYESQLSAVT